MLWKEKGRKESENGEGEGKREMKKNWVKEKGKVRAQNCPPAGLGGVEGGDGDSWQESCGQQQNGRLREFTETAADYMKSGGPNWQLCLQSEVDPKCVFVDKIEMVISPKNQQRMKMLTLSKVPYLCVV